MTIKSISGVLEQNIECCTTSSKIWNFYYGITGIEKATRKQNGMQNLTIDYTTDTNGRILSAAYSETGGFNGELFYTFDSFGNTVALTNTQGNVIVGYLYDLNNGAIKSEYNPQGIDNPYKVGGKEGSLAFSVDSSTNVILYPIGNDYII